MADDDVWLWMRYAYFGLRVIHSCILIEAIPIFRTAESDLEMSLSKGTQYAWC
jgi:hypothetical protein